MIIIHLLEFFKEKYCYLSLQNLNTGLNVIFKILVNSTGRCISGECQFFNLTSDVTLNLDAAFLVSKRRCSTLYAANCLDG